MAKRRGPGGRQSSNVPPARRRKLPGLRLAVTNHGELLEVSATAPKPDNWAELGLRKHPPGPVAFTADGSPHWSPETMQPAFTALLQTVRHRANSAIALKLYVRDGEDGPGGKVIFPAANDPDGPGGLRTFSEKLDVVDARAAMAGWAGSRTVKARKNVEQFMLNFNSHLGHPDQAKGPSYRFASYIYRIGVILLKNKKRYSAQSPRELREWHKRYAKRSRLARSTT